MEFSLNEETHNIYATLNKNIERGWYWYKMTEGKIAHPISINVVYLVTKRNMVNCQIYAQWTLYATQKLLLDLIYFHCIWQLLSRCMVPSTVSLLTPHGALAITYFTLFYLPSLKFNSDFFLGLLTIITHTPIPYTYPFPIWKPIANVEK